MAGIDNSITDRGNGLWVFALYKPEEFEIGPFDGALYVSKDFHSVQREDGKYVVNIPSQNVAYAVDANYYKKLKKRNNEAKSEDK